MLIKPSRQSGSTCEIEGKIETITWLEFRKGLVLGDEAGVFSRGQSCAKEFVLYSEMEGNC